MKYLLFIISSLTTINISAQVSPSIKWGESFRIHSSSNGPFNPESCVFYHDGGEDFVAYINSDIHQFKNLNTKYEVSTGKPKDGLHNYDFKLWKIKDKYYVIKDEAKGGNLTVTAAEVNFEAQRFSKNPFVLMDEDYESKIYDTHHRDLIISNNGTKFLALHRFGSEANLTLQKTLNLNINVWNENFKEEYRLEESIEVTGKKSPAFRQMVIAENGNIFLLVDIIDYKGVVFGTSNYRHKYVVYCFNKDGLQFEKELELGGEKVWFDDKIDGNAEKMVISEDNKLRVVSPYANKKGEGASGVYVLTVDCESLETISDGKVRFPNKQLAEAKSISDETFMQKKKPGLFDLKVRDVVEQEDGSIYVVLEDFVRSSTQHISYICENIHVLSVSKNNTNQWFTTIPKSQSIGIKDYTSYHVHKTEDGVHIIYPDNAANVKQSNPKKLKTYNGRNPVLISVFISKDGVQRSKQVIDGAKDGLPRISDFISLEDNKVLAIKETMNTMRLGIISF